MKAIKYIPAKNRSLVVILSISGVLFLLIFLYFKNVEMEQNNIPVEICESLPIPVFSVPEGIYDQSFELEIFAPNGYAIFYTTDGSTPSIHSKQYKKPIKVNPQVNLNREILNVATSITWQPPVGKQNHSTVMRARCFKNGEGYGKIKNVIYNTSTIEQHKDFQVVHILIEADSLFHPVRGIYILGEKYYSKRAMIKLKQKKSMPQNIMWSSAPANYHQRGVEWARPAVLILIDKSGKTMFEQNITIRTHGLSSRAYPEKSLRIISDSLFHYSFFDYLPYQTFKRILLRNSGQDISWTLFRDAMLHELVMKSGEIDLDIQAYVPSVLYINGNYWGIHNIREKQDEDHLSIKYGSSTKEINIIEHSDYQWILHFGDYHALQSFEELIKYINENDLNNDNSYQHVCSQMDIDNFIDYVIVQTYFANIDWAVNNMKLYRIDAQTETMKQQNIEAGKWRWFFYDLDAAMINPPSFNMFDYLNSVRDFAFITPMFWGLMENSLFKEKFLKRYEFIIENCFDPEKLVQHIESFEKRYETEIERQVARWRRPPLVQRWRSKVNDMKVFARERPDFVKEQLKDL